MGLIEHSLGTLKIYPNPSNSEFNLELLKRSTVKVFTILGEEVYNKTLDIGINKILLEENKKGIYTIHVIDENSERTEKIVVQ